ncbi:MAG: ADP-ribosylglycohydrolase family protein [Oscillatoria sp. Prado101]|jgi:ADP-ribosylglycohydrolase|nr:ADP-ribosylglycohydrolase family protein [Oscillatoria sp. Prado101]
MLLELAVGDAYGAGFEYADAGMVMQYNNLSRYVQHPRHRLKPGSYTDDTQMSLAIAETIVAGEPWVSEVLASRFVATFCAPALFWAKAQLQTFFCLISV